MTTFEQKPDKLPEAPMQKPESHESIRQKAEQEIADFRQVEGLPENLKEQSKEVQRQIQILRACLAQDKEAELKKLAPLNAEEQEVITQKPTEIQKRLERMLQNIAEAREAINKAAEDAKSEIEKKKAGWWDSIKNGLSWLGGKLKALKDVVLNTAKKIGKWVVKHPILTILIVGGAIIGAYSILHWGATKATINTGLQKIQEAVGKYLDPLSGLGDPGSVKDAADQATKTTLEAVKNLGPSNPITSQTHDALNHALQGAQSLTDRINSGKEIIQPIASK